MLFKPYFPFWFVPLDGEPNLKLVILYYSQLRDDCLSATTASCPLIQSMILMSCQSVGPDGLSSLRLLSHLTLLDLSYTFLTNLQPVFESCLQLKVNLNADDPIPPC